MCAIFIALFWYSNQSTRKPSGQQTRLNLENLRVYLSSAAFVAHSYLRATRFPMSTLRNNEARSAHRTDRYYIEENTRYMKAVKFNTLTRKINLYRRRKTRHTMSSDGTEGGCVDPRVGASPPLAIAADPDTVLLFTILCSSEWWESGRKKPRNCPYQRLDTYPGTNRK